MSPCISGYTIPCFLTISYFSIPVSEIDRTSGRTFLNMAAPPVRARADYDFLVKLLLIGDSGMTFLNYTYTILIQSYMFLSHSYV